MADIQLINRVYNLLGRNNQDSSTSDDWGLIINNTLDAKKLIMLESNNWSFGEKYKEIPQKTTTDNPSFKYAYSLPIDCTKVLVVYKPTMQNGVITVSEPIFSYFFEILGKILYSDIAQALVKYKTSEVNTNELPQAFIDALAYLSASEVAMTLLENSRLSQYFASMYIKYKDIARANDAQNGKNRTFNAFGNYNYGNNSAG